MKRALYIHGFLGDPQDMKPLFLEDYECDSVDVRTLLKTSQNKPDKLLELYKGPYDFSVAYSYGGRLLAQCLLLDPNYVDRPIFCSSRVTIYSPEELRSREMFKEKLFEKLNISLEVFFDFWESLSLFSDHSMKDYRSKNRIDARSWTIEEITNFLKNHFTYSLFSLEGFEEKSWYFYGEKDSKYKREIEKLKMKYHEFSGLGHRFLFEDIRDFKKTLINKVLN